MSKTKKFLESLLESFAQDDYSTFTGDVYPEPQDNLEAEPVSNTPQVDTCSGSCASGIGMVNVIKSHINEKELERNFKAGVELIQKIADQTAIVPTYVNFSDELVSVYFPESGRHEVFNFNELQDFCSNRVEDVKKFEEDNTQQGTAVSQINTGQLSQPKVSSQTTGKSQQQQTQQEGMDIVGLQNKLQQLEGSMKAVGQDPETNPNVIKLRQTVDTLNKQQQSNIQQGQKDLEKMTKDAQQLLQKNAAAQVKTQTPVTPTQQKPQTSMPVKTSTESEEKMKKPSEKSKKASKK